jgi:ABC-2 type transport system permease protein
MGNQAIETSAERPFFPYLPFWTLVKREVLRFMAVSVQTLVTPVITASLYLLVFGVSLGSRIQLHPDLSYIQFVVPGLILMGVVNNAFANSSSSIFFSRYIGNIVDLLVTPLSPAQFLGAYTLAAVFRGALVGIATLGVSLFFTSLPFSFPLTALIMIFLASFVFAQFGIIAGIYSNTFDNISMYTNFLILPLIYTGGLFYPVSELPPFWRWVSLVNPLTYMIDGFRKAMIGVGSTPLWLDFTVTLSLAVVFFLWAWWLIRSGYKLRN